MSCLETSGHCLFNSIYTNKITFSILKLCFVALCTQAQFIFLMSASKGLKLGEGLNMPAGTGLNLSNQIFENHVQEQFFIIYKFYWQWWIHTLFHLRQGHFVYPITGGRTDCKMLLKNVICPDKPINAPSSV